ncbi:hypothetical protein Adeg_1086 [Ammonifex degensii KC4]|uniref:VanZ family protein n=1 Tax=Ammonifex degensii (strain DSM 10501 / KC4) TaxID=429009 RepID=C9RD85_AMMDK|nr:hypothetical protein [Ammonifex degensii]ACX52212.1 hypothetical protein Adeg_1086 [Ammonifex degensii KC4]
MFNRYREGNNLPRGIYEGVLDAIGIFAFLFGERLGQEERLPTPAELRDYLDYAGVSFGIDLLLYAPPHRPVNAYLSTAINAFLTGLVVGVMHRYREKK